MSSPLNRQISIEANYATYLRHDSKSGNYFTNHRVIGEAIGAFDGSLQPGSPLYLAAPFTIWVRAAWGDLDENGGMQLTRDLERARWRNMGRRDGRPGFNWGTGIGEEYSPATAGLCRYEWWNTAVGGAAQVALYTNNLYAGSGTTVTYKFQARDGVTILSSDDAPADTLKGGTYTVVDDDLEGPRGFSNVAMRDPLRRPISTTGGTVINANIDFIELTVSTVRDPDNAVVDDATGFDGVERVDVQLVEDGAFPAPAFGAFTTIVEQGGNAGNNGTWRVRIPQAAYFGFDPTDRVFIRVVAWDRDNEDGEPTELADNADRSLGIDVIIFGPFFFVRNNLTITATTRDGKSMTYIVTPPYDADPGPEEDWRVDIIKRIEGLVRP